MSSSNPNFQFLARSRSATLGRLPPPPQPEFYLVLVFFVVHEVADGPRLVVEGVGSKALAVVVAHQKKSELLKSQGMKELGLRISDNWLHGTLSIIQLWAS